MVASFYEPLFVTDFEHTHTHAQREKKIEQIFCLFVKNANNDTEQPLSVSVWCANAIEKGHSCGLIFSGHLFVPVWRSSRQLNFTLHLKRQFFCTHTYLFFYITHYTYLPVKIHTVERKRKISFITKADNFSLLLLLFRHC